MRQRQRRILRSEFRGKFRCLSVEGDRRPPARHPRYLAVSPAHAMIRSRTQRLHRRFLGRETRGITLEAIRLGIAIANLFRGKYALEKARSEAFDGLADARNLGDVNACAYDHDLFPICDFRFSIVRPTSAS
jgi:hypothetical protein